MKKTAYLLILLVATALVVNAQSKSNKMYDVFSGKDGVSNFSFSKNMIDVIDLDFGDDDDKTVSGDLHQIRFMSYNPEKGDLSGPEFTEKAIGYLPKSVYKKYEGEDEENDAEIWLMGKKKNFNECHVFIKNENDNQMRFVISFYGDFNVNDIDDLKKAGEGLSDED